MNSLVKFRLKHNLTQEQLSEKSSISVRTIQRIENGIQPKGHTLKALAKALEINENDLLVEKEETVINAKNIKYVNLSSLPFTIFPPLNILIPILFLLYYKKQDRLLIKQIVSIQIVVTIVSLFVFMICVSFKKWLLWNNFVVLITMVLLVFGNVCIILRNAAEIDRKNKLYIQLGFNLV